MPNLLFEQHLLNSMPGLKGSDTPLLDEEAHDLTQVFNVFGEGVDEYSDLDEAWQQFGEYFEFAPAEIEWMSHALYQIVEAQSGNATEHNVRKFLKTINSGPFPKPDKTTPNAQGFTPLRGEGFVKKFLKSLATAAHPDPFHNTSFLAKNYKAFDRQANRYGVPYSYANDWNNQSPSRPLANPILNVSVFEAIDSIGAGFKSNWKVLNTATGEYVTRQIQQEEAEQIAYELNCQLAEELEARQQQEYAEREQELDELSNRTLGSYVKRAANDQARQHVAAASPNASAKQHDTAELKARNRKSGIGKAVKRLTGEELEESALIASTPITENLLQPLSPQFLAAFRAANARNNFTMAGNVGESDYTTNHAKEWRETRNLINESRKRFNFGEPTEHDAIRTHSIKNLQKKD